MGVILTESSDFAFLIFKIIKTFPNRVQKIVFKILVKTQYLFFGLKFAFGAHKHIAGKDKIFHIPPNKIIKCLSLKDRMEYFSSEKNRGKIVGGNWDITNYEFANTEFYEAFRKRVREGVEWRNTDYYKRILKQVESGNHIYSIKNESDLDERCKCFDMLYEDIKNKGGYLNSAACKNAVSFGEIDVNIGRNGEYIFRDGIHRLSIAKILGLKYVPVTVFVRHKKWQEFRDFLFNYAQHLGGQLYQPPVHPDLVDLPYNPNHQGARDLREVIKPHVGKEGGLMLDIGANMGFWCHKFEDLGFQCIAVEQDPVLCQIMERIRIAENKNFRIINKSIFEADFVRWMHFDVVLALNVFHHFLKTESAYFQLVDFLESLETDVLFFEPHMFEEPQMDGAYVNYSEFEFVDFLLEHTSLTKSELVYSHEDERPIFKLIK